jgi:ribonuclease/clavin/mitogillin
VMIAGDMVAGEGTILVEPTDGDMAEYLASLARMGELEPSMLLPAHGMPIRDPQRVLDHYVAHRLAREAKILAALSAHGAPASPAELLPRAYDDAPRAAWPLAALSIEAHLIKLEREGRARRVGGRWSPTE